MAGFGMFAPGSAAMQGMGLLRQVQGMQRPAGGGMPTGLPEGMPDFLKRGMVGRLMSDNPGGLIGAIMKRQNAPVNPGVAPAAGDPAYFPGGEGPMAGGSPSPNLMGLLSGLFQR